MTVQSLPEGWQVMKFGDIARHISKRVEPNDTELNIYVGLEHLDPNSLKIRRHGVPSDVTGQKLLVKKGQIIFGKRRAYQRKVAVADWDCICSAHAMVLEENTENIVEDYLPLFMQSEQFFSRAIAVSEGSLSPTIKWKVLAEQKFHLPSRKEQLRIVKIQKKIQKASREAVALIESTKKILGSFIDSQIISGSGESSLFVKHAKLGRIPKDWEVFRLQDVCELIIDCKNRTPDFVEEGFPVLRTSNIRDGVIRWEDMKYTDEKNFKIWTERGAPREGDLIITREAPIGEVCLIPPGVELCMGQRMMLFRANNKVLSSDFMRFFCMSRFFQRQLLALSNGSTVGHVRVGELKRAFILVPSLERQQRVVSSMCELESILRGMQKKESGLGGITSALA